MNKNINFGELYLDKLQKEMENATGKTGLSIEAILGEQLERNWRLFKEYIEHLYDIYNVSKVPFFDNQSVETGLIGEYDTLTSCNNIDTTIVTPVPFSVQSDCVYNGFLMMNDGITDFASLDALRPVPSIHNYQTILIHNPGDFDKKVSLECVQNLLWNKAAFGISVFGYNTDKDKEQKLVNLRKMANDMNFKFEQFAISKLTIPLIVKVSEEQRSYGSYFATLHADPYVLQLLPDEFYLNLLSSYPKKFIIDLLKRDWNLEKVLPQGLYNDLISYFDVPYPETTFASKYAR